MNPIDKRIRVALVGCGQIADAHLQQIARIPFADVVAVCDVYQDLADQAAARFNVPQTFVDADRMFAETQPDVVHITTPAHTHRALALLAIQAGVHAYVEKPFTLDADEAVEVVAAAEANQRLLCVGHDQSFDPMWREVLDVCRRGELGTVQHVESVLAYPLQGQFGRHVVSDPQHWVRRLPGGLFHNTISHPLYRITDLMPDEYPDVWATWFSRSRDVPIPTELRAQLRGRDVTATLLFLSSTRPMQRISRIYGTQGGLEVDFDSQLIRRSRDRLLPGAFEKLQAPLRHLHEAARNVARNLGRFARSDLHYFAGMKRLFELFYTAILTGGTPPISHAEIQRVTRIMDEIFDCCRLRVPSDEVLTSESSTHNSRCRRHSTGAEWPSGRESIGRVLDADPFNAVEGGTTT
jgi:predicted dehydrogenase